MTLLNNIVDLANGVSFIAGLITNPVRLKWALFAAVVAMLIAFGFTRRIWPAKFAALSTFLIILLWQ